MTKITKHRTLRPSSRLNTSAYEIDTINIARDDVLRVEIEHENNPGELPIAFEISGIDLAEKNSIHFELVNIDNESTFNWKEVIPLRVCIPE